MCTRQFVRVKIDNCWLQYKVCFTHDISFEVYEFLFNIQNYRQPYFHKKWIIIQLIKNECKCFFFFANLQLVTYVIKWKNNRKRFLEIILFIVWSVVISLCQEKSIFIKDYIIIPVNCTRKDKNRYSEKLSGQNNIFTFYDVNAWWGWNENLKSRRSMWKKLVGREGKSAVSSAARNVISLWYQTEIKLN